VIGLGVLEVYGREIRDWKTGSCSGVTKGEELALESGVDSRDMEVGNVGQSSRESVEDLDENELMAKKLSSG
jgi:hypothetical protein